jgi:cytochrome c556
MKHPKSLFAAAVMAVGLAVSAGFVSASDPVHDGREQAMKGMGGSMKAIKDLVAAGGPAADIVAPAQKIAEIAATIPDHFPAGSDTEDDEASAKIWENWEDFTAHAKSLQDEATLLASAAQGGDMATVGAQFDKVGGACGACHKAYREKK